MWKKIKKFIIGNNSSNNILVGRDYITKIFINESTEKTNKFETRKDMAIEIKSLLIENKTVWQNCGPESQIAKENPLSNSYEDWNLKKQKIIIPNNKKIIKIIKQNNKLFEIRDYITSCEFIDHAESFETGSYLKLENQKQFPKQFEEVIDKYVL